MSDEQQYHFFAATAYSWATAETIDEVLKKVKRQTKQDSGLRRLKGIHYFLFSVPLPESAHYLLRNYAPQVEGTRLIENAAFK